MRNTMKLLGIIALVAVIGFTFAACGDDNDDGNDGNGGNGLTITGLGAYNDKWACAVGGTQSGGIINAFADYKSNAGPINGKINNGSVTLKLYNYPGFSSSSESGNVTFNVKICNSETSQSNTIDAGTVTVNLKNGNGSGNIVSN